MSYRKESKLQSSLEPFLARVCLLSSALTETGVRRLIVDGALALPRSVQYERRIGGWLVGCAQLRL